MIRKELGKISRASWGRGGYQDAQVGVSFSLEGKGWGVCDFWGHWGTKHSDHCKWSEVDRLVGIGEAAMRLNALLETAKKYSVADLVGVPVEVTFDGNALKEWRLLEEVL
jgi:hypothetical protein